MKWVYELMYRYSVIPIPFDAGPRDELVSLVESGQVKPCRAIDLGSGTASNVIYLAQHGFDVTGADYSTAAIEMGRLRAREAEVEVTFIKDDVTNLQYVNGTFDLLVDYGCLHSIRPKDRPLYVKSSLSLTHQGSIFLVVNFERPSRRWERQFVDRVGWAMPLEPGEIERRFGEFFEIERLTEVRHDSKPLPGMAGYMMTRNLEKNS
jgi:ubiquinone/menaquinone biosynthesis C-methylase UbiE